MLTRLFHAVLCSTNVDSGMHTHMSSSYRWLLVYVLFNFMY